ncbi:MAG: zinc-ribbon domain-containing protein [Pseudomonadota bacterium]
MRLECPTCQARYEVAASAIPPAGRSVQCGACGTTWFQEAFELAAAAEDIAPGHAETLPPEPEPEAPLSGVPAEPSWPSEEIVEHNEAAAPVPPTDETQDLADAAGEEFVDFSSGLDGEELEDPPTYRTLYRKSLDQPGLQIEPEDPVEAVRRRLSAETLDETGQVPPAPSIDRPKPADVASDPAASERQDERAEPILSEVTKILPRRVDASVSDAPEAAPLGRVEPAFATDPRQEPADPARDEVASLLAWNRTGRGAELAAAEAEAHAQAMAANPAVPGFGPQDTPAVAPRRGFAAGLALSLLLFLILLSAYGLHAEIAGAFPGTAPVLTEYVALVDTARGTLQGLWQQLVGRIEAQA